jgi:glycosyltransferase involved in cell wall biosynthesis
MHIVYFHRNRAAGYSIHKVTQTVIRDIEDKEEYELPYHSPSPLAVIKNMWFVYRHRRKDSINHVTGDVQYAILALGGCKSVLTCHDTVSLDFRKLGYLKRIFFEWLWYRLPLKYATKVVAISDSTRECLKRYTKRNDIEVIPNAIDPIFEPREMPRHAIPQVLLIGTSPNKNLLCTFDSLKGIKCQVDIIGKLSADQLASLKANRIEYSNRVGLSDTQILDAYAQSDVVSFVSLFEGFGMIIVEANKVGRPVICSDIPVLREVGGEAALFVNPHDVEDMHQGFERIIADSALRELLVARGYENAKRFNVDRIRQQWKSFYESL